MNRFYVIYVLNKNTQVLETAKDFDKVSDAIRYADTFENRLDVYTRMRVVPLGA